MNQNWKVYESIVSGVQVEVVDSTKKSSYYPIGSYIRYTVENRDRKLFFNYYNGAVYNLSEATKFRSKDRAIACCARLIRNE